MVYLEKLDIRGFKSFGSRKITINFDKGLTVITGPNGTGKSNILDAVSFVLGDLSARSLRTDRMAGVIFDGVQGKTAASYASVTLHLDNNDRRIPVDTDIITISRKVNRTGTSEYSLNGRRIPRGQLVDVLNMASISSSGYNLIMQGTITRLADITPEERRKVIEDLIGIDKYDAKKAEARIQLQQADMNLRIASARIGDVQARLERLEEERNDALRYNFICNEMKRLQATLISFDLQTFQSKKSNIDNELKQKSEEAEILKQQYNQLINERDRIESERRIFDEEVVDRGNIKFIALQKTIGDLLANITSLKMEIDTGKTYLEQFQKTKENKLAQIKALEQTICDTRQSLLKKKNELDKLFKLLNEKKDEHSNISSNLGEMKLSLEEKNTNLKKIEDEINNLSNQILKFNTKLQGYDTRQRFIEDNLKNIKERRDNFEVTLKDLQQHYIELQKLQKNGRESLEKLSKSIDSIISKQEIFIAELAGAENTVKMARDTLIEFGSQNSLAKQLLSEESSLQRIEEMVSLGAIQGILGRLENLIMISSKFHRAIESASSGWLKSLVVRDLETALKCVEYLKKTKLGRIKLIPITEVEEFVSVEAPDIEGVISSAARLISCNKKYVPAINSIFGDTIVTSSKKSAFLVSRAGYRTVDLNGDLYEASGGVIGGYYRKPINFSSLVPSEKAVDKLNQSVKSLEDELERRRSDMGSASDDVIKLKGERIRQSEMINSLERELKVINRNISRARQNNAVLDERIDKSNQYCQKIKTLQQKYQSNKGEYKKRLSKLISRRKILKFKIKPHVIAKYEKDQTKLNIEINDLSRELVKIENDINFLESNLKNVLTPEFEETNKDLNSIEKQIVNYQNKIERAQQNLNEAEKQANELENSKEKISSALSSVQKKRKVFEEQLDNIYGQLKKIDEEALPLNNEVLSQELKLQRNELNIKRLAEEMLNLGYERRYDIKVEDVKRDEAAIKLMRLELEQIGSVNQLAITQYKKHKENYKQLSIRQNELEKEKGSILDFMEEIESRKKETFTQAFKNINENFTKFFFKLTGGGKAYLSLPNLEDPFSGGLDIFAQFPGKTSRLIAGASGGEKSVAAVSFIFTIQSLFPAPFYIFDEIDAHLDPYNTERLADLLKEQSVGSQLIVLTLRDVIMDRAGKLFGVYIQDGISRIVSAKIKEVAA